jgi:5-hydroxyisourate hydrolase-like protein (transthyretin family)
MKKYFSLILVVISALWLITSCKKDESVKITTISGQILNSQTGLGLENVTLSFCKPFVHGLNSTPDVSSEKVFTVSTNHNGRYLTDSAIVGTYTLMIEADNFFTSYIDNFVIESGPINNLAPITIVQKLSASLLRIVLTWGKTPYDLDSHFTGPIANSSSRFHIYYLANAYNPRGTGIPDIRLDADGTSGFGPETITINRFQVGTYRYSVFNYIDQTDEGGLGISNSPASVNIYDQNGLVQSFYPPVFTPGGGNAWAVFEIISSGNGIYRIVNTNTWINMPGSDFVAK